MSGSTEGSEDSEMWRLNLPFVIFVTLSTIVATVWIVTVATVLDRHCGHSLDRHG